MNFSFWFCFLIICLLFILATLGFPCSSRASHCTGFCRRRAQALGPAGFSNCDRSTEPGAGFSASWRCPASWRWSPIPTKMERSVVAPRIVPGGLISPDSGRSQQRRGAVSVPGQLQFRRGPSRPLAQGGPWHSPTALRTPTPHPLQVFLLVGQLSNFRGKLFFPGGIPSPGWVRYLLTVKAISSSLALNIPC